MQSNQYRPSECPDCPALHLILRNLTACRRVNGTATSPGWFPLRQAVGTPRRAGGSWRKHHHTLLPCPRSGWSDLTVHQTRQTDKISPFRVELTLVIEPRTTGFLSVPLSLILSLYLGLLCVPFFYVADDWAVHVVMRIHLGHLVLRATTTTSTNTAAESEEDLVRLNCPKSAQVSRRSQRSSQKTSPPIPRLYLTSPVPNSERKKKNQLT